MFYSLNLWINCFADLQFQLTMQAESAAHEEDLRAQVRDLNAKVRKRTT